MKCPPEGDRAPSPDPRGRARHGPQRMGVPGLHPGLGKPWAGPAGGRGRGLLPRAPAIADGVPRQAGPVPLPSVGQVSTGGLVLRRRRRQKRIGQVWKLPAKSLMQCSLLSLFN